MGYCHRESIKGHAIQEMPKIDLSINPMNARPQEPKYKIVPSFPPTLARMWCMQIVPTHEIHQKLMNEALKTASESKTEADRVKNVQTVYDINKLNS